MKMAATSRKDVVRGFGEAGDICVRHAGKHPCIPRLPVRRLFYTKLEVV